MHKKHQRMVMHADPSSLYFLRPQDVVAIDRALERVGGDGQVHLIVEGRRLSYIQTVIEHVLVESSKRVARAKRE